MAPHTRYQLHIKSCGKCSGAFSSSRGWKMWNRIPTSGPLKSARWLMRLLYERDNNLLFNVSLVTCYFLSSLDISLLRKMSFWDITFKLLDEITCSIYVPDETIILALIPVGKQSGTCKQFNLLLLLLWESCEMLLANYL